MSLDPMYIRWRGGRPVAWDVTVMYCVGLSNDPKTVDLGYVFIR